MPKFYKEGYSSAKLNGKRLTVFRGLIDRME